MRVVRTRFVAALIFSVVVVGALLFSGVGHAVTDTGAVNLTSAYHYEGKSGYVKWSGNLSMTSLEYGLGSDSHLNFTASACGSSANPAWNIGFGPDNGNFTHICSTPPTSTDYYFDVNSTSGATFNGTVYYVSQPTYLVGTSYAYSGGEVSLTAPGAGSSAAVDFNVGALGSGLALDTVEGSYLTSAPSYNPNLLTLTLSCAATCTPIVLYLGSEGTPYYVQVGSAYYSQGSGWTYNSTADTVTVTQGCIFTCIVSWSPLPASSGSSPGGSPPSSTTVTTTSTTAQPTNSTAPTTPAPPPPLEALTTTYLVLVFGGIILTFIAAYYSRKDPWVMGGVIAAGAYLTLDLVLYVNQMAQPIDAQIGIPLFIDFGFIAAPVEGWLASLGPTGSVVALAVVFGALGSVPLWAKPLNDWLEKVV